MPSDRLWLTTNRRVHRIKTADRRPSNLLAAPSFNGRTADSGSAYRGSNPWGAAKLSPITCIRPLRIFSERGAKRSYCTSNGLVL
jgi:hypothetical protein